MMQEKKKENPIPQGKYVPATRWGDLIFTAGMTPRVNGVLIRTGKIDAQSPLQEYKNAVCKAAENALTAARNQLKAGERIAKILSMTVYINSQEDFTFHSKLADFASDYLCEELGEVGIGCRTAVGVFSLPGNAPVEIQLTVAVCQ